ncbi:HIT family protein [Comamonas aquatica]|uniref:HIT family protein n=1 Tax=Comamonas aquatica TaxID=225991 RepID=UPI002449B281|nr:HIT family protein [Comamonas aquatica]MDH0381019.1 HIT family protein [Comamonas aquatica]MDH0429263.1 HIT family protein [Comamonas aquatica]MDH0940827.1 HIT family protein [Comamonas aquatica]MDH1380445.1 HIT family protein [Comamonas aquatica]MDH1639745.1 HIT family protein [Comamonas aquatica]
MSAPSADCVLCREAGGLPVWQGAQLRVIRAQEEGFPAFYRVIWTAHVAELSDLSEADRNTCMAVVAAVERVLRTQLQPTKINLAALGNMVPHLHWHVIARHDWDSHFPAPVWANPLRARDLAREAQLQDALATCDAAIAQALARWA